MAKVKDLTGVRFGKLTVLSLHSKGYKDEWGIKHGLRWLCKCDCGTVKDILVSNLSGGNTVSCGCIRIKHGLSKDPLSKIWSGIRSRILKEHTKDYSNYGGRGLCMEPEWVEDFLAFHTWIKENLGERPSPEHTIDRVKNELGYLKGNLRWATSKQQNNNRRGNRQITYQGETKNMKQWAEHLGLNYGALKMRLGQMGWSVEEALSIPTDGDHNAYKRLKIRD